MYLESEYDIITLKYLFYYKYSADRKTARCQQMCVKELFDI